MNVATESQIKEKEDPKTFSLTLTGDQIEYLSTLLLHYLVTFLQDILSNQKSRVYQEFKGLKDNND